jgi:hypothetical protein
VTASDDERRALLRKYRLLAAWRRARDGGGVAGDGDCAAPAALRRLADEFPGALRELDLLRLAEIERRVRVLQREETSGGQADDDDDWIAWIAAYHGVMREALAIKRALRGGEPVAAGVDRAFAEAVGRPPGGRLSVLVLRLLGERFGVPAARISATLFPARRPPPYTL